MACIPSFEVPVLQAGWQASCLRRQPQPSTWIDLFFEIKVYFQTSETGHGNCEVRVLPKLWSPSFTEIVKSQFYEPAYRLLVCADSQALPGRTLCTFCGKQPVGMQVGWGWQVVINILGGGDRKSSYMSFHEFGTSRQTHPQPRAHMLPCLFFDLCRY